MVLLISLYTCGGKIFLLQSEVLYLHVRMDAVEQGWMFVLRAGCVFLMQNRNEK